MKIDMFYICLAAMIQMLLFTSLFTTIEFKYDITFINSKDLAQNYNLVTLTTDKAIDSWSSIGVRIREEGDYGDNLVVIAVHENERTRYFKPFWSE